MSKLEDESLDAMLYACGYQSVPAGCRCAAIGDGEPCDACYFGKTSYQKLTTIETSHGTVTVVESEAVPKNGGFNLIDTHERVDNPWSKYEWWLPKTPEARDAVQALSEHADSLLTGVRLDRLKPPSFDWAKVRIPRVVTHPVVTIPLHIYASYKRQCDEGQRCAPLPRGYPQCPCNCGGPFGDCLR